MANQVTTDTCYNYLNLTSYNSQGHGAGRFEYIQYLCKSFDFVFVQEHWLFDNQCDMFENKLSGIKAHSVSSMDENNFYQGRPFGGCAIIWNESLNINVTPILTNCNKLCVVSVMYNNVKFLLCNVYMPCNDNNSLSEYENVLCNLSLLFIEHQYDHIILGGDFNIDFSKHITSNHAALTRFLSNE